ncbi:MAG TPA: zinc ribbon domain-containing protein [Candidatus Acidoferrum sp.]|nr:zinc ribbon domain-containing protein [Candidatus Acidoferrum sp.]
MFCDRCGAPIAPGAQFCTACGKAVLAGVVPEVQPGRAVAGDGRVQRHLKVLAILWLVTGILRLIEVAWIYLFARMFLPGLHIGNPEDWPFSRLNLDSLIAASLHSVGIVLAIFGVAHLVLAWGLLERERWARTLGLVLGFLALIRVPFGTALGIYTMWVLLPDTSAREYDQISEIS